MAIQPPPQATTPEFVPTAPARIEDSGLPVARLADLLLKHIYFKSPMQAKDCAAATCLPYQTVTPAIQSLVEQGWCQTIGRMAGPTLSHDFGESLGYLISDPGRARAARGADLHPLRHRHRGPGDARLRSLAPPAGAAAAANEFRQPLGAREAALCQGRRRADDGAAVALLRPVDALLRGTDPPESQRRHLPSRRLRPPGL